VEAGVLAPSADNRHCFEVSVVSQGLQLLGNAAFLDASFHRRHLGLLSIGAVVENMTTRAAALGYDATATFFPDASRPAVLVDLRLSKTEASSTGRDEVIVGRHTNRRLVFSGPRLSDAELQEFNEALRGVEGVTLAFFDKGSRRRALLRIIQIAEAERFNNRALHEDLFASLRFDAGWHSTVDEGLPPAALAIEPGARMAFAQLRHWPLMNSLRRVGVHRMLGFRAATLPCRLAPHLGLITTSLARERGAVAAGMVLERVWLEAERRGLALQPFAASSLLALPDYGHVPAALGERLRSEWMALTSDTPMMVFRLGRAPRPAIRTARRPIDTYIRG
jgi:hypothetical protein